MEKATIFFTDEKTDNKDFAYLLWFQPSYWMMLWVSSNGNDVFDEFYVLLDGRYFEKKKIVNKKLLKTRLWNKDLTLKFVLLDKDFIEKIKLITDQCEFIILEKQKIPYSFYDFVRKKFKKKVKWIENYFESKRILKEKGELEKTKKAIVIIDSVYEDVQKLVKSNKIIGMTELKLRQFIINKIFEYWWVWESFWSVIATWSNSAIPHHETGKTIISEWALLMDIWAVFENYCSDFTRTVWIWEKGEQYKEFNKVFDVVKTAHNKAFDAVKPWVKTSELDKIARDYIDSHGYWKYFTHSLGHGIGLDVHEKPWMRTKWSDTIEEWMLFTIEPWVYLPWNFGIRYENIVYCWKSKGKIFSKK